MRFVIFKCSKDPEAFVVTDEAHAGSLSADICPTPGGRLERIGDCAEMGEKRVAFNEAIAKGAIRSRGYYIFGPRAFSTS